MLATKVDETLSERPIFVRIGLLWYMARPLTLAQMWEIGAAVETMDDVELSEGAYTLPLILSRHGDFRLCERVALIMLFRSRWKRWLWGWYVRRHLTSAVYKRVVEYAFRSFSAGFFLTALTFLKGIKTMTSPTRGAAATAPGASSEE